MRGRRERRRRSSTRAYRRNGRDVAVGVKRERGARVDDGLRTSDLELHRILLLLFAGVRCDEVCDKQERGGRTCVFVSARKGSSMQLTTQRCPRATNAALARCAAATRMLLPGSFDDARDEVRTHQRLERDVPFLSLISTLTERCNENGASESSGLTLPPLPRTIGIVLRRCASSSAVPSTLAPAPILQYIDDGGTARWRRRGASTQNVSLSKLL